MLVLIFASLLATPATAHADHFMCDWRVEQRPQAVSIDPDLSGAGLTHADVLAAFEDWNALFERYHGFPIFVEYFGDWWDADVLLTAHGWDLTWVQNRCFGAGVQRGSNHSIVFIGRQDAWRNCETLPHELGHALGLGDHGEAAECLEGHIGFKVCDLSYIGVMSYCTSPQAWFLDGEDLPGTVFDGQMVQRYWSASLEPTSRSR